MDLIVERDYVQDRGGYWAGHSWVGYAYKRNMRATLIGGGMAITRETRKAQGRQNASPVTDTA